MYRVTEKYKYYEAKRIVADDFYSEKTKEKPKEFIKQYLKNKNQ